ncbi:hypothetical protein SORBI_3006G276801 [Sorghum bicolor]|uniref:F-box domain-containing protein n=1 Tax=Sorghum bicolor TaxID=4558 RepID=C5YAG1_SORBI|nr:hypothetical protein SORBI_3006G276801 [Sorghum bicolor]
MPPPELMDELVEEILVRFPPGDPASLVRAALVCKPWCRLVSGAAFRRRFREFHHLHRAGGGAAAAPPLLGVLYNSTTKQQQVREDDDTDEDQGRISKRARILREPTTACFVPTTSFRPGPTAHAANSRRCYYGWRAIDARHGRVLLRRSDRSPYGHGLSVWDPVTDEQQQVPKPKFSKTMLGYHWTAAVACAATDDCDHLDCHRGPFLVVVMDVQSYVIYRCVYSSQAAAWSDLDVLKRPEPTPGVLVGSTLYFLVHCKDEVVEYDLATQEVSTIDIRSSEFHGRLLQRRRGAGLVLLTDDDGGLGLGFVAIANNNNNTDHQYQLELWSMVNGSDGAALINNSLRVNGFGGGATANSRFLFMRTTDGLYSIDINSSHVSKVANNYCGDDDDSVVPYISFCTPNSSASGNTAMSIV